MRSIDNCGCSWSVPVPHLGSLVSLGEAWCPAVRVGGAGASRLVTATVNYDCTMS